MRKQNRTHTSYYTLVQPHLEYCCTVWNPHTVDQKKKLERTQRKAARYVTNRYHNTSSVTDMLDHLQWEILEARRTKCQLSMFYKITNNLVDIHPETYLSRTSSRTRANHSLKFRQISTKKDYFKFSFFPRTIPVWNSLPAVVAEAPSLAQFKRELSSLSL